MFASLIRRKGAQSLSSDQAAFESTTFSLSTAVPRPVERRIDERLIPLLKVAKLSSERGEQLIRVRNISAGGLMAEIVDSKAAWSLASDWAPLRRIRDANIRGFLTFEASVLILDEMRLKTGFIPGRPSANAAN